MEVRQEKHVMLIWQIEMTRIIPFIWVTFAPSHMCLRIKQNVQTIPKSIIFSNITVRNNVNDCSIREY